MKISDKKEQEIKEEVISELYSLFPKEIEGEVGVGKFRTTFHRIYKAGDGWMMGGKAIYVIVECMNKLIKLSKSERGGWMMHHESGGASRLDLCTNDLFGHKIRNAEVSRHHRENGTLERSLR